MGKLPSNFSDVVEAYKACLNENITTAMFGNTTFKFFSPRAMYELAFESNIDDVFSFSALDSTMINHLKEKIRSDPDGARLFALGIYCGLSLPDLSVLMTNYDGTDLPLSSDHQLRQSRKLPGPVFDTIRSAQHCFLAPCFCELRYRNDFTDRPVPIEFAKGTRPDIGEGSGGKIYKARIHNSCLTFSNGVQWPNGWSKHFALKISKFKKDAERELNFLESLAKHRVTLHEHITKFYTGFVFEQKIYLIAELADGNLNEFMAKYPDRRAVSDLDRGWLLAQLNGLADALSTIHDMIHYHHDIKPTNILVFNNPSADLKHRLKFTDFGSAGDGVSVGSTGNSAKSKVRGTTPTLPPETHNNGESSRPHDVWSLGCVFLDILTWYNTCWEVVKEFRSEVMEESEAWCYYDVIGEKKVITVRVSTALYELASVEKRLVGIIYEMLEMDPDSRLKAATVFERLSEVAE